MTTMSQVIKSQSSTHVSYIMVLNLTGFQVDVVWIDYEGRHVKYKSIPHRSQWNSKTYVTHPWVFFKAGTRDQMNIVSRSGISSVLFPKGYKEGEEERVRMFVLIRPVHSLKQLCFRTLYYVLELHKRDAQELPLPRTVIQEFTDFVETTIIQE